MRVASSARRSLVVGAATVAVLLAVLLVAVRTLPVVTAWSASWLTFSGGPEFLDWVKGLGPFGIALAAAAAVVRRGARWARAATTELTPQAAAIRLSTAALSRYQRQAIRLGLDDPAPLTVRLAPEEPTGSRGAPSPATIAEAAQMFRQEPDRQLVVLGEPGAGKSVFALMLARELLLRPGPASPVPVVLSFATWDPTRESLEHFVVRRLAEDNPFLAGETSDGRSLAAQLVADARIEPPMPTSYRVMPVLDGLDEIRSAWRAEARRQVDAFAVPGRGLVVTCRTAEYQQLVSEQGRGFARATVQRLQPTAVADVSEYLAAADPPRWAPVVGHLSAQPGGVLARVLSTPLMAALARAAYGPPASQPRLLLERSERPAIVADLIDGYVHAVFAPGDQPANPARARRVGKPGAAESGAARWLSCLARQLQHSGSRAFGWRLDALLFSAVRTGQAGVGLLAAVVVSALAGLAGLAVGGAPAGFVASLAVTAAIVIGTIDAFSGLWSDAARRSGSVDPRRRWPRAGAKIGFHVLCAVVVAAACSDVVLAISGAILTAIGVLVLPTNLIGRLSAGGSPVWGLREIRDRAVLTAAAIGGIAAAAFAVAAGFGPTSTAPAQAAVIAAVVYGVNGACASGLAQWVWFRAVHAVLAFQGWLPWRLQPFLREAVDRGALREAGGVLQFRHAVVQDQLADYAALLRLDRLVRDGDLAAGVQQVDLLAQGGRVDEALALLRRLASHGSATARERLDGVAARAHRDDEPALRQRSDDGSEHAELYLAALLVRQQKFTDLLRRMASVVAGDDVRATAQPAGLPAPASAGSTVLAIGRSRRRDGLAGQLYGRAKFLHSLAGQQLAEHLWSTGDLDGLRRLADLSMVITPDAPGCHRLADLLADRGLVDELRQRADAGDIAAAQRLARYLAANGQIDELRTRARKAGAEPDDPLVGRDPQDDPAGAVLAAYLRERGDIDGLRELAGTGEENAITQLVAWLAEQGLVEELTERADHDGEAADRLIDLYLDRDLVEEAFEVLVRAADAYLPGYDPVRVARFMARYGGVEEALRTLANVEEFLEWTAVDAMADILADAGRLDEAVAVVRRAMNRDGSRARSKLVRLLADHGDLDEAVAILRAHATVGDQDAADELVDLLAGSDRADEAAFLLTAGASVGNFAAARRLLGLWAWDRREFRHYRFPTFDPVPPSARFSPAARALAGAAPAWGAAMVSATVPLFLLAGLLPRLPAGLAPAWWEAVSLPLATLCLSAGTVLQRRRPELASWATLGPGLIVGLLPTLFAVVLVDDQGPVRRILLPLAAAGLIMFGLVRRQRAPLQIGAVTLFLDTAAESSRVPLIQLLALIVAFVAATGLLAVVVAQPSRRRASVRSMA